MKKKYLFVSMGAGEFSQAVGAASYISKRGEKIIFCALQEINLPFLEGDVFPKHHTPTPEKLKKVVLKEKPDIILYFNSKIWKKEKSFRAKSPFPNIPSITVDSNWLFNEKKYPDFPHLKWSNKHLVNLPKNIFHLGLKENGGGFSIPPNTLKEIKPVGFVPFHEKVSQKRIKEIREKYCIKKDEKFIFSYFGGFGAGHRLWALEKLLKAVDKLIREGRKIKIIYVGSEKGVCSKKMKKNWITHEKLVSWDLFSEILSSSDLVFQHQGLATLTQAIYANIPVITNVKRFTGKKIPEIHLHEVTPFEKTKTCIMQKASTSQKEVCKNIENLLYNKKSREKIIKGQKNNFYRGENAIYHEAKKLLK